LLEPRRPRFIHHGKPVNNIYPPSPCYLDADITCAQTTFTPLNIIPDSDSEGEVDNTEEIQIEEALKLYQQALRHHTDGTWEEASKAYEELFRSEIFRLDVEEQVLPSQSESVSVSENRVAESRHGSRSTDATVTLHPLYLSFTTYPSRIAVPLSWTD
jgi:hypothetical protein